MFNSCCGAAFVAPTRGIIMEVGYRLEFYNPADCRSTVVEIIVHEHVKDCIKLVVEELAQRAAAANKPKGRIATIF